MKKVSLFPICVLIMIGGFYSCDDEPVEITVAELCGNGIDDDEDGFTDCADADCSLSEDCNGCSERTHPSGGPLHVGQMIFSGGPELTLTDSLYFLIGPPGQIFHMHRNASPLPGYASVYNAVAGQYDIAGFTYDQWVVGEGDTFFDVTVSEGHLWLTSCFSVILNYIDVEIGSATHPDLAGETFPIQGIDILTSVPFTEDL